MQRFKTRPQFQAALAGNLIAKSTHFALHRVALDSQADKNEPSLFSVSDTWIGAMVPKRWAKRAVTRNAIKRQIYTVSTRLQHAPMPAASPAAFLVRLRREFSRQVFSSASSCALKEAVRAELLVLIQTATAAMQQQEVTP
jgi:ribonuclease P protein component